MRSSICVGCGIRVQFWKPAAHGAFAVAGEARGTTGLFNSTSFREFYRKGEIGVMKICVVLAMIMLLLGVNHDPAAAAESEGGWSEAGVRMGMQAGPKREYFHSYELFAAYELPWEWRSTSGWGVTPQLNTSIGALHGGGETGFLGSGGTGITVDKTGFNLVPDLGINLNLTDRRHFGKQDFGSILLFGAYIGLSYRFDNGLGIGYRILHLSNNRILYTKHTPNPGADLHQINLSWNF